MATKIEGKNFQEIINSGQPVLIDFWAAWCGPCRVLGPTIDELAEDYEGRAIVGKVNVDENPELAEAFQVRSIPTLLFFKDGQLAGRAVGVASKTSIAGKIDELIGEAVA